MKSKKEFVPDWAKDAVWYQIFPERFRNGTSANDPRTEDFTDQPVKGWNIMPWGADWYKQQPWEKQRGDFFSSVYLRRFGGDLVGVREKLDYLEDLGVTAIYLNPVFHAPSLHKYDASSFHHVDPSLGPDREGDLKRIAAAHETEDPSTWIWTSADQYLLDLIQDVHSRGMRIILDGVFNHTGREFFAFRDLLENRKASRYRDWYEIKTWGADGSFEYEGWFGHQALPELGRTKTSLVKPVEQYVFDITRRWMDPDGDGDPSDGIDGWRLDVAFCVPHGFWKKWRKHVKKINPEAYLTAEIVTMAEDYLQGDEFDAVMNYMWLFPTVSFFGQTNSAMSSQAFRRELNKVMKAYPPEVSYVQQNLFDSHDVGRVASVLNNPGMLPVENFDDYFNQSRIKHGGKFTTTKPAKGVFDTLRQMVVFQMTYPGAPMIYYGTEVGMWGANDPCDRQPMFWDDVAYEPEAMAPDGTAPKRVKKPDHALRKFYRKAISIRRDHAALRRGSLRWANHDNPNVLMYDRMHEGARIRMAFNTSGRTVSVDVPFSGRDLWTGKPVAKGRVSVAAGGWSIINRE